MCMGDEARDIGPIVGVGSSASGEAGVDTIAGRGVEVESNEGLVLESGWLGRVVRLGSGEIAEAAGGCPTGVLGTGVLDLLTGADYGE